MKKIFTILCWVFLTTSISAQVNSYFQNNPVWAVSRSCAVPYPCIVTDSYNYYVVGDTILNSLVYKQIFQKGTVTSNWMSGLPNTFCFDNYWYIHITPEFFLRSAGKKIYIRYPSSDTTENLLYNFDLNIGDTIIAPGAITNDTVISIDSILTLNGYMKLFELSSYPGSFTLIEGVGHYNGLTEPMGPVLECGYSLNCWSLNNEAYFPDFGLSCNMNVSVENYNPIPSATLFPNPINTSGVLVVSQPLTDATVFVFDSQGKMIRSDKGLTGTEITINRENLAPGIYLLRIENNEFSSSVKMLITD